MADRWWRKRRRLTGHFGTVDASFTALLAKHGLFETFPLFEVDRRFFADQPTP